MTKSLNGIIRLHKWQVDEKRRQIIELEVMKEALEKKLEKLLSDLVNEQENLAKSNVVDISYANYASSVMSRKENLEASITEIDVSIEEMKDELSDAFKELKKYEIVEQRALEREKELLEIEFQTRANQQQLANWNRVEFGYQAPEASQYLENERQLASLGMPRRADAPEPIRVALAPVEGDGEFPSFVSPLTGEPAEADEIEQPQDVAERDRNPMSAERSLSDRLALDSPIGGPIADISE